MEDESNNFIFPDWACFGLAGKSRALSPLPLIMDYIFHVMAFPFFSRKRRSATHTHLSNFPGKGKRLSPSDKCVDPEGSYVDHSLLLPPACVSISSQMKLPIIIVIITDDVMHYWNEALFILLEGVIPEWTNNKSSLSVSLSPRFFFV